MVPPTLFISGGMAVLHLCNEVYTRLRSVKRWGGVGWAGRANNACWLMRGPNVVQCCAQNLVSTTHYSITQLLSPWTAATVGQQHQHLVVRSVVPDPLLCCLWCCRYRKDCEKLARFVHRIEAFITETEDDADMTAPAWQAAFEVGSQAALQRRCGEE